ncbi:MAG: MBL fold metallo-hydrolase [Candidatus Woesearchaeota archaeon]
MLNIPITFTEYGAAESINGSKGILQIKNKKHLIDYGKDYNIVPGIEDIFPVNTNEIADIFATHAHADHIGALGELIKAGFNGSIYSTYQTSEITGHQLKQESSMAYLNNKAYNDAIKGKRIEGGPDHGKFIPFKKGFTYDDVKKILGMFASDREKKGGFAYKKPIIIDENLTATFFDAGHIPGSAQILFDINVEGKNTTVLTACDLGRTDYFIGGHPIANIPIVKAPEKNFPKPIDHIILEATYGAKVHKPLENSIDLLYNTIIETSKRGGKLIIPAFSIMRTHLLSVILYDFYKSGKLPSNMQFYISSPGADDVSKIITAHPEDMDPETFSKFKNHKDNPFWFERLIHHKKFDETQAILNANKTPYCIIAASGMCDMGRVVPILKQTLSDPNTTVALLGYQAQNTKGYKLLHKDEFKSIKFDDVIVPINANVVNVSGFSGHVDSVEAIAHLKHLDDAFSGHHLKSINIKHGDKDNCYALAAEIQKAGFSSDIIRVLKKGQTVNLD